MIGRELLFAVVHENPGINKRSAGRRAGILGHNIDSYLANMENRGLLLSEDDHGGLYPYTIPEPVGVAPCRFASRALKAVRL